MQRPLASPPNPQMLASRVEKALAGKNYDRALAQSEQLVAAVPDDGGYRALLGRAYLARGRYQSARVAFQDAIDLGNRDVRTIISLALVNIALGDARAARDLLADHRNDVPTADYGLAMAMAGDAEEGVRALVAAARQPDATIQTRQNLAYALALAGAWGQARLIAGQDLAAREAEQRIGEWSRGGSGQERVIAMLGVAPQRDDAGLPTQLALRREVRGLQASAPVPGQVLVALDAQDRTTKVSDVVASEIETAAKPMVNVGGSTPCSGCATIPTILPDELVSMQPVRTASDLMRDQTRAAMETDLPGWVAPSDQHTSASRVSGRQASEWVVQLGAFDSAAIAREGWRRIKSRQSLMDEFEEVFSQITVNGRTFHRLAIRGFETRDMAQATCRSLSAAGQACFVRRDDNGGSGIASDKSQKPLLQMAGR